MANRPDIIIKNQKEKRYKVINVVIPEEINIIQKVGEKNNYK